MIRYAVAVPGPGRVVFVSDVAAGAPRYRLACEIAPGAPSLTWEMRRTTPPR